MTNDLTAIRALKFKLSKCADVGNLDLSNVPESHETIWLQWGDNGDDDDTWCADNINDEDVPYVRADLVFALCDEVERLRRMLDLRGTGPAERYWEGRWRDEAADNERLREALTFYTVPGNWCIDGPLDGDIGNCTGGPARSALGQEGGV